ncbi:MAG: AAA family ATPase [Deltaproteobacteria bacterium]|jgi:putative ATP-dependent endonuclease of OLD family|nr:AAA family ATPase [Deltaproteobacteria bacterium]
MNILIKAVRISGFRGLQNIEVELEKITVLTGMNNTGKTSFLKALQLALGYRQFVSQDDFFIQGSNVSEKIIIDLLIIPINPDGRQCDKFSGDWEILFTTDRIRMDDSEKSFVPLRTIIVFDQIKNSYKTQQFILQTWPEFEDKGSVFWFQTENGTEKHFRFDEVPFFYMDAQRDILEDIKLRTSYLGKMISKIEYSEKDIIEIEEQIKILNEKTVNSSDILSNIKTTLKGLDTAMDTTSEGVEITPFTKKIRDLNKGLSIYYTDKKESFSMEYHGMGTRSWSSLLTLKAFISLLNAKAEKDKSLFSPILAIEEPEAHIHPNAQRKLYEQINEIFGQKIIATHSPYIAASAELKQIRNFYKHEDDICCGKIKMDELEPEDIRKIERQVINTRGEIFFSKAIVFCEGETEEQALHMFAEHHFDKKPEGMGINFVGIGGNGNYLPFMRFAEGLNILWFIFSDAEGNVKNEVQKQFNECGCSRDEKDTIVFLDNGNNFEKQLISDGFSDEIKKAIIVLTDFKNKQHRQAKTEEINSCNDEEILKKITNNKTKHAPVIAEKIIESKKELPPKIIELFNIIQSFLGGKEVD